MQSDAPPSNALGWVAQKCQAKDGDETHRPRARSCHTLTTIGTNCFLFGGMNDLRPAGADDMEIEDDDIINADASDELFKLNLSNKNNMEWSEVSVKGSKPIARWRHTMTVFENTQILLFGGFHNTEHRLNDVWVFDTIAGNWIQPNAKHNEEATASNCVLANNEWVNVPPPRAGHSATCIGDLIYIFGGYGGSGYSRRDLDDLFSLNIYDWTWTKLMPKGTPPEKRSGHQACAIENKVFIMGGSSSSAQFDDVYVLDTELEQPLWSKMSSCPLPIATWNHCACSVIAIPTWKIFTFGGLSGSLTDHDRSGKQGNGTCILDTGASCRNNSLESAEG
jgi:dynein heavy chain